MKASAYALLLHSFEHLIDTEAFSGRKGRVIRRAERCFEGNKEIYIKPSEMSSTWQKTSQSWLGVTHLRLFHRLVDNPSTLEEVLSRIRHSVVCLICPIVYRVHSFFEGITMENQQSLWRRGGEGRVLQGRSPRTLRHCPAERCYTISTQNCFAITLEKATIVSKGKTGTIHFCTLCCGIVWVRAASLLSSYQMCCSFILVTARAEMWANIAYFVRMRRPSGFRWSCHTFFFFQVPSV